MVTCSSGGYPKKEEVQVEMKEDHGKIRFEWTSDDINDDEEEDED